MTFDLCFAEYNSEKWLRNCVRALANTEYDHRSLNLYFADNASQDNTVERLSELKQEYEGVFGAFEILRQQENRGFGTASNAAARAGRGDYVFFLNLDTEIFPDAFLKLEKAIKESSDQVGAFEMRQFPYEHPKYYDPVTMETSWASGACLVLRRCVFEQTGGFDESIFMYAEDVDLSWHIRALGYKIRYLPQCGVWHYTYQEENEEKPTQVAGSLAGNLVLRYKYGSQKVISEWTKYHDIVSSRITNPATRELLGRLIEQARQNRAVYRKFYRRNIENSTFQPQFLELDYEVSRGGAFYKGRLPVEQPRFTIVIRTYQRPDVLALTLKNLTYQTYRNFKVLVVEDGKIPVAARVVEQMREQLEIQYLPLREAAGRCKAGNAGIAAADTEFVCFLDDDDYFFAEYLETMACQIEEHPECDMFLAGSIEGACRFDSEDGTKFSFVEKKVNVKPQLRLIDLFRDNPVPIQAVVFRKSLYERFGGFDESLDALEDWDLWMRYASQSRFVYLKKATSIYKVPAEKEIYAKRDKEIGRYRAAVYNKMAGYMGQFSAQEIFGLFWTPEQSLNQRRQEMDEKSLRATAEEIRTSTSWRLTMLLRAPFDLIRGVLLVVMLTVHFLIDVVHWGLCALKKMFLGLYLGWCRLANWIGPWCPNIEQASIDKINSFVVLAKRCFSMRIAGKISRAIREKRNTNKD